MARARKVSNKGTKVKFAAGTQAQFEALKSTSELSTESTLQVELAKFQTAAETVLLENSTKNVSADNLSHSLVSDITIPIPRVPTVTYTVQPGDTIEKIACKQSVPVAKLKYLNPGIKLIPGTTLIIR